MTLRHLKKKRKDRLARTWPQQIVRITQDGAEFDITRTVFNVSVVDADLGGLKTKLLAGQVPNGHGEPTNVWCNLPASSDPVPKYWLVGKVTPWPEKCPACGSPAPDLYPDGKDCEGKWHGQ